MKKQVVYLIALVLVLTACEKWYSTEDVSHISYLPKFEIIGGDFVSVLKSTDPNAEYKDPGVIATSDGKSLKVYAFGEIKLTEVGVYVISYVAQNDDGLMAEAERTVIVTDKDVSKNDLSGSFAGTNWDSQVKMKVKKIHVKGLYECDEVMGFPGSKVPGRFVDLGDGKLVLLHGEGFFGKYGSSEGEYTRSTLSWTIFLLDDPYKGFKIPVIWRKTDD